MHYPTRVVAAIRLVALIAHRRRRASASVVSTTRRAAWPWIIHAAEGLDDEAAAEFERLDALGCIGANTLIVHGVALDPAQRKRLVAARERR